MQILPEKVREITLQSLVTCGKDFFSPVIFFLFFFSFLAINLIVFVVPPIVRANKSNIDRDIENSVRVMQVSNVYAYSRSDPRATL